MSSRASSGRSGRPVRARWTLWCAAAAVVAVLAAWGVVHLTADRGPSTGEFAGFSPGYSLLTSSAADLDRDLETIAGSGAGWVRVDVDWSVVEQREGQPDFASVDRVVRGAVDHGLQVLALVAYTPDWARPAGTDNHHPPTDAADFADFAGAVAQRYGTEIAAWEIWNEPNLGDFWSPAPDPAAYAALLRATAPRLRAEDPGAPVLVGGLGPAETDATRVDPVEFLAAVYDAGARGAFDAVGVHPYSYPALPGDRSTLEWNTFVRLPMLRAEMVRRGDGELTVWITEFGAPTGTADDAVSPERQAQILTDGFEAVRDLPWVAHLFVYSLRDSGTDPADREQNFGMLAADRSPKPAWATVRDELAAPWGRSS